MSVGLNQLLALLTSERCRKASDITNNVKPIGPEFSKIHTQLSKIKSLELKHNSISLCISVKCEFCTFS